jgi:putative glutamine amidotransferase
MMRMSQITICRGYIALCQTLACNSAGHVIVWCIKSAMSLYDAVRFISIKDSKPMQRPLIGIAGYTRNSQIASVDRYIEAVRAAGGLPIIIPPDPDPERATAIGARIDGLLLPGGDDVDPSFYGADPHPRLGPTDIRHDHADAALIHMALERRMPLLAICRGHQILNVALGGTLYQDVPSDLPAALPHSTHDFGLIAHRIQIISGTLVHAILNADAIEVNSLHHQAIRDVAPGAQVTARAPDGVIEGIALSGQPFALAVQYHPEGLIATHDHARRLFAAFIAATSAK